MKCSKCGAYFCWLCMTVINAANPYTHFNSLTSPCFNKLFLGVVHHHDDDDVANDNVDADLLDADLLLAAELAWPQQQVLVD